jgi:hypothetical protein
MCGRGWLEGRLDRLVVRVSLCGFHEARWELQDCSLLKEAFDSYGFEGFSHIQQNCASWPPLVKVSVESFNKAGQLQLSGVPGAEPKLLGTQQSGLVYFPENPSDLFKDCQKTR